jgi:hypothetical protein
MLDAAVNGAFDAIRLEKPTEHTLDLGEPAIGRLLAILDLVEELVRLLRMQVSEAEILHLHLDAADTEAVRDRGKDVEGLASDRDLAVATKETQSPHVVQPVRQLDENHAQVVDRRQQQAAEVLGFE